MQVGKHWRPSAKRAAWGPQGRCPLGWAERNRGRPIAAAGGFDGLHDLDSTVFAVDGDIGELALAFGLPEHAHGDQPDLDDLFGHRAADAFGIVLLEIALLGQPSADVVEPAAHHHMGLAVGPSGDGTPEL